jgi:hypothetical protein
VEEKSSRERALDKYYLSPNICLTCKKVILVGETSKVSWTKVKKFCNKSCAATFNNSKYPKIKKIKKEYYCKKCKELISNSRKYCEKCYVSFDSSKITLQSLKDKYNISQYHAKIRGHSRQVYFSGNYENICKNCKYSKHIEVCHIKEIKSFSLTSTLYEVNNIKNLIGLCPNCHWELDNGFLKINTPA